MVDEFIIIKKRLLRKGYSNKRATVVAKKLFRQTYGITVQYAYRLKKKGKWKIWLEHFYGKVPYSPLRQALE